jgi:hypothetical protein
MVWWQERGKLFICEKNYGKWSGGKSEVNYLYVIIKFHGQTNIGLFLFVLYECVIGFRLDNVYKFYLTDPPEILRQ